MRIYLKILMKFVIYKDQFDQIQLSKVKILNPLKPGYICSK